MPAGDAGAKIELIAIGSSTGGTEAISAVLKDLRPPLPGIVITQHIPPLFAKLFAKRLEDQGVSLKISRTAKTFLADKGYDPGFGARPLKRVIVNELENPVSRMIVSGDLHGGMTLAVDRSGESLSFAAEESAAKS